MNERTEKNKTVEELVLTLLAKKGYYEAFDAAIQLKASETLINKLVPMCVECYSFATAIHQFLAVKDIISSKAVDDLIAKCIEQHHVKDAVEAALLLNPSNEGVESLLQECIVEGDARNLLRVVGIFQRPLNSEEIDTAIRYCLANKSVCFAEIFPLMKLGASQEVIDGVARTYIQKDEIREAISCAKLGASPEVISLLAKRYIEGDDLFEVSEVAKLVASPDFTEALVKKFLDRGSIVAIEVAKLRPSQKLTEEEVEVLVQTCVAKGWVGNAIEAAGQRETKCLTEDEISYLIQVSASHGRVRDVKKIAEHRGRDLSAEEIQLFIDSVDEG